MDEKNIILSIPGEETTQAIGKMKFVVVSQYKETGSTVYEKIELLLKREAREKNEIHTYDRPGQAGYNE